MANSPGRGQWTRDTGVNTGHRGVGRGGGSGRGYWRKEVDCTVPLFIRHGSGGDPGPQKKPAIERNGLSISRISKEHKTVTESNSVTKIDSSESSFPWS